MSTLRLPNTQDAGDADVEDRSGPLATVTSITSPTSTCDHDPARHAHAGVSVESCGECSTVAFTDRLGTVEPATALGKLFGEFDLVGPVTAIAAPGRQVLMYRAPDRLTAAALRVIDPHTWFEVDESLWVSHDDSHLLFSHDHPTIGDPSGA